MVTNSPTEMRVMWITPVAYDNGTAPVAEIGTKSGVYGTPVPGVSTTYTVPPRWWGGFTGTIQNVSRRVHHPLSSLTTHTSRKWLTVAIPSSWLLQVLFTGLTPSTRYYYRVGGRASGSDVWSAEFSFVAAPTPSLALETKIVTYGDMGTVMPLARGATGGRNRAVGGWLSCHGHAMWVVGWFVAGL